LPIEKLHVDGYLRLSNIISGYPFIRFNNSLTGGNSGLEFRENEINKAWIYYNGFNNSLFINADNTGGYSPHLVVRSDGNIGLGTATPAANLHVAKNLPNYTALFGDNILGYNGATTVSIGDNSSTALLYVGQSSENKGFLLWNYAPTPANAQFWLGTYNGSNPLVFQPVGGNVGVRTNAPAALFHVAEESPGLTAVFGRPINNWTSSTNVSLGDDNGPAVLYIGQSESNSGLLSWQYNPTPSNAYFNIATYGGSNPLILQGAGATGGKVGIGTISPAALFHVAKISPGFTGLFGTPISTYESGTNVSIGDDNASPYFYIGQNTSNKGFVKWDYNATPANAYFGVGTYAGANPLILQEAGGMVGIGTTTPSSLLDVAFNLNGHNYLGYSNIYSSYFYHNELVADGDGQTAIYAYRTRDAQNDGTGYSFYTCNTAMKGYSYWGDVYSFGLGGFNYNDFTRCGGVLGAYSYASTSSYWGSLGYKNSGSTTYGGYFTSSTNGTGKSAQSNTSIGIGAWGDLMGADIHGKVYGVYAEGENYSLYSNGPVFKNNLDVHLQNNGTAINTVLYTNVSTDATIQTFGVATLSNGIVSVSFDPAFTSTVSQESPIIVTVTPTGKSYGVYLSEVSSTGFTVVENNDGKSNTSINFIAIGKRAGFEHPVLPQEILDATYTQKMARGLHNDADTQTNGEGLYYENGQLVVGVHPSLLPDPNRATEDPNKPVPGKSASMGRINPDSPTGVGEYTPPQAIAVTKPKEESPAYGTSKTSIVSQKTQVIPTTVGPASGKIEAQPVNQPQVSRNKGISASSPQEISLPDDQKK
jgi:hypothetical protein